jgi:DNA primase
MYPDGHFHCFGCSAHGYAIDYIVATRGVTRREAVEQLVSDRVKPLRKSVLSAIKITVPKREPAELWESATAPEIAELYLESRGIRVRPRPLPEAVRGHLSVYCAETKEFRPATLCAISGADGRITAIQKIWCDTKLISENGHSPEKGTRAVDLKIPKKIEGTMGTGAVRLAEAGPVLGLAEGLETAMSAAQLFSIPVWATCGAHRLDKIQLPEVVRSVVIFGDFGKVGEAAAAKALSAYTRRGYAACAEFPPEWADWNRYHMAIQGIA